MTTIAILNASLSYLRFNYVWPKKGQDRNPGKWYFIKFSIVQSLASIILVGSILHVIVSVKHHSTRNLSEDFIMLIAEIGVYYFLARFVSYQKEIAEIYLDLSDFEKFGKAPNFDERNKRLVFLSRLYKSYIDFALVNFFGAPYLMSRSCEKMNEMTELQEICGIVAPTWMPFDISTFPKKHLFWLWQILAAIFTLKGAAVISFAIFETIEHVVLRIQHLKILLNEAISTDDDHKRQKLFAKSIAYHIDIFDIGKRMDKCYTGCLFLHVLLTGALFGCIGFRFKEGFSLNGLALFCGWFMSLYIVCISGQHLIDQSNSVGDVAYNSDWGKRDVNFQKNMTIIIIRSQTPIVVHAGPFSYCSHVIILNILKTAYSYLTLLNATSV